MSNPGSSNSRIFSFNSEREYSAEGQRIIAEQASDGVVTFWDIDRGICRQYESPSDEMTLCQIMRKYDIGGLQDVRETDNMRYEAVRLGWYNSQYGKPSWWNQYQSSRHEWQPGAAEMSSPGMMAEIVG